MDILIKLQNYRKNVAMLEMLNQEAEALKAKSELYKEITCYLSAVRLSEVPRSVTNKFNSTVENLVCEIEKGNCEQQEILFKSAEIESEKIDLQKEIIQAETFINSFTPKEQAVLRIIYIDGVKGDAELEKAFEQYMGWHAHINTIFNIKKRILNSISSKNISLISA